MCLPPVDTIARAFWCCLCHLDTRSVSWRGRSGSESWEALRAAHGGRTFQHRTASESNTTPNTFSPSDPGPAQSKLQKAVSRNRKPLRDTTSIEGAMRKWIYPAIGDLPLALVDNLA